MASTMAALQHAISSSSFLRGESLHPVRQSSNTVCWTAPRSLVQVRASATQEKEGPGRIAKTAVAAAALALVVTAASPGVSSIQAAFAADTSPAGKILAKFKAEDNAAFAEAQRTGKESVGAGAEKVASGEAAPAISQVDSAEDSEPADSYTAGVAERAERAAEVAPGTSQQEGKGGEKQNLEKAFATATRGLADKEGANEGRLSNIFTQEDEDVAYSGGRLTGNDSSRVAQVPNLIDRVKETLRQSAEGRDRD